MTEKTYDLMYCVNFEPAKGGVSRYRTHWEFDNLKDANKKFDELTGLLNKKVFDKDMVIKGSVTLMEKQYSKFPDLLREFYLNI